MCKCVHVLPACLSPAFWDATRAFMLLAVLSCFAGVVLGLSAFTNGTKNKRVRTGGIALVLSGNAQIAPGDLGVGEIIRFILQNSQFDSYMQSVSSTFSRRSLWGFFGSYLCYRV